MGVRTEAFGTPSVQTTQGRRPRLLDLFCGAGGAAMGYHRAGFEVVGVDIKPQPHYPFEFHQADAMAMTQDRVDGCWHEGATAALPGHLRACLGHFDAIHASPPCQAYSEMSACRPGLAAEYPDLILPTRQRLQATGLPWVMENVPGSPLISPIVLCGTMFKRELYRHRLFEASFPVDKPLHPAHVVPASKAGHWTVGTVMSVAGHFAPVAKGREIMDIDWMNRDEMAEAVPPDYTEWIGAQLLAALPALSDAEGGRIK